MGLGLFISVLLNIVLLVLLIRKQNAIFRLKEKNYDELTSQRIKIIQNYPVKSFSNAAKEIRDYYQKVPWWYFGMKSKSTRYRLYNAWVVELRRQLVHARSMKDLTILFKDFPVSIDTMEIRMFVEIEKTEDVSAVICRIFREWMHRESLFLDASVEFKREVTYGNNGLSCEDVVKLSEISCVKRALGPTIRNKFKELMESKARLKGAGQ